MLLLILNAVSALILVALAAYFIAQEVKMRRRIKKRDRDFAEFKRVFEQIQGTPIPLHETRTHGHPFVADTNTRGEN